MRGQYPGHLISLSHWDANIQIMWTFDHQSQRTVCYGFQTLNETRSSFLLQKNLLIVNLIEIRYLIIDFEVFNI